MRVVQDGAVWTVVLDRPARRNAVDRETADALYAAFLAFDADPVASVAVLWGEGPDFCAGADLRAIAEGEPNRLLPVEGQNPGPLGPTRLDLHKPVIAAIEGHAVAGGLELACWADLRIAADNAVLGVFCRRWGVPLIDGGTVRLPRLIGLSRATELILSGRPVLAAEALHIGLVHRVVPPGQTLAAALAWAHELAKLPQAALRADLHSARQGLGLRDEFDGAAAALSQVQAGGAAFLSRDR